MEEDSRSCEGVTKVTEGKEAINKVYVNEQVLLWATGAQSHWGIPEKDYELPSEPSYPRMGLGPLIH